MQKTVERRTFLKGSALALGTVALGDLAPAATPEKKAQVFFTSDLSGDGLLRIYSKINQRIKRR